MKKIVPVISLLGALLSAAMSLTALGLLIYCAARPSLVGVTIFTIPLLIASTVAAGLSIFVNFMFFKDNLCRIGLVVGLVGLVSTIAGYVVIMTI